MSAPLQSRKDIVNMQPFNRNIVPEIEKEKKYKF
jgi:hypothetical protein